MDLQRKIEIVERDVRSISDHSDEDAAVLHAALTRVEVIVNEARARLDAAVAARVNAMLGG